MSERSGRELEIAVAKALGWRVYYGDAVYLRWAVVGPNGGPDYVPTEQAGYDAFPAYLTDPIAFASVLAALDAADVEYYVHKNLVKGHSTTIWYKTPRWKALTKFGTSYQEALCRAFVAWKEGTRA